jgi:pimeloyl-ACP methyl ester carboxylesterase
MSQRAEQAHPPRGRFLRVANVQLYYVEAGKGTPVVILHGNGGMIADLEISGLIGHAGKRGRAIAFDRPGFGYSTRPDDREWSPEAQAEVIAKALEVLGVTKGAVVIGHSWGTLVAQALALNHPTLVGRLILASGYYFPTLRSDTYMLGPPSYPVVGRVLRHTVAPIIGRATRASSNSQAPDRRMYRRLLACNDQSGRSTGTDTGCRCAVGRYERQRAHQQSHLAGAV